MPALSDHLHVLKKEQTPADKAEKARQKIASLDVCNVYAIIFSCILGLFTLRYIILQIQYFRLRRQQRARLAALPANEKKGSGASSIYSSKPALLRASDRIDALFNKPVGVWPLTSMTWLRLILLTTIISINIVACLVVAVSTRGDVTLNANAARAFSRRAGRVATANFPLLYSFAGRNSIIHILTGFPYQEIRYYHKVVGSICTIESIIHTLAYTGYYVQFKGVESLHEEYTEAYFKWGIAAVIGCSVACIVGLRAVRTRWYELFLISHIVGAVLMLAGSWYHRPIMVPWVYAGVAVWVFERTARLTLHVANRYQSRLVMHNPILQAEASVCHGAIRLSVPFPSGTWEAGQHAYISFWGSDLLRRPHLYGQSHPFSVANVPDSSAAAGGHHLQFVLRIHNGITRELAGIIARKTTANKSTSCPITISIEGLHGHGPAAGEFDNVLLVAGGSGITHVASILSAVCMKADQGLCGASNVKLVWAVHHLDQAQWIDSTLDDCRARADRAGLNLEVQIFVTRNDGEGSGRSTPTSSTTPSVSEDLDEKKELPGSSSTHIGRATVHRGRPQVAEITREFIAAASGRSCIVACGPDALAEDVRAVTNVLAAPTLEVQIAKFEC